MDPYDVIDDLTAMLDSLSYGNHPFVLAMLSGEASRFAVGGWACQQSFLARYSSQAFGILAARADDWDQKADLLEKATVEMYAGRGGEHHWRLAHHLARACGWTDDQIEADEPKPETRAVVDAIMAAAAWRPWQEGVIASSVCGEQTFLEVAPRLVDAFPVTTASMTSRLNT